MQDGRTAVMLAIEKGRHECFLKLLIAERPDLNLKDKVRVCKCACFHTEV